MWKKTWMYIVWKQVAYCSVHIIAMHFCCDQLDIDIYVSTVFAQGCKRKNGQINNFNNLNVITCKMWSGI